MKKTGIIIALLAVASTGLAFDWFAKLDQNKDGKVTVKEWIRRNRTAQLQQGKKWNEEKSRATFAARDLNGDGVLSRDELGE